MGNENKQQKYEIPEILYEEPRPGEPANLLPYIEVKKDKKMPPVIFIFEYKETGETEPDEKGNEAVVVEQIPHMYLDMAILKEKLPPAINDAVRVAFGMLPLKEAQEAGAKIVDKAIENVNKAAINGNALTTKDKS
jgi:hypothetical protein